MAKPLALVIEDDYDAAEIMTEALQMAGYDVSVYRDGTSAQEGIAAQQPDLVALDLHLPGVDGEMLLKQIRSDDRLKDTRVMLATADDRLSQQLEGDANMVLLKPISFAQLHTLAKRFISTLGQ